MQNVPICDVHGGEIPCGPLAHPLDPYEYDSDSDNDGARQNYNAEECSVEDCKNFVCRTDICSVSVHDSKSVPWQKPGWFICRPCFALSFDEDACSAAVKRAPDELQRCAQCNCISCRPDLCTCMFLVNGIAVCNDSRCMKPCKECSRCWPRKMLDKNDECESCAFKKKEKEKEKEKEKVEEVSDDDDEDEELSAVGRAMKEIKRDEGYRTERLNILVEHIICGFFTGVRPDEVPGLSILCSALTAITAAASLFRAIADFTFLGKGTLKASDDDHAYHYLVIIFWVLIAARFIFEICSVCAVCCAKEIKMTLATKEDDEKKKKKA